MKIYTKTGDAGESGLFGGKRVPKDDPRLEAYGTLDELNSLLGLTLCETVTDRTRDSLNWLQNVLFMAGADLATLSGEDSAALKIERISKPYIDKIEAMIDEFSRELPELRYFILPGGTKAAALLHVARTVCRRAERAVVSTMKTGEINGNLLIFVNRLSDFLFVLSRYENRNSGIADTEWK